MKKELDEQLVREFPLLYADRNGDARSTCMVWGFCCGDGWFDILYRLSQKLEPMIANMGGVCAGCWHAPHEGKHCSKVRSKKWLQVGEDPQCSCFDTNEVYRPRASQVKEKFATLRYSMTLTSDEIEKAIHEAEQESARTCEECGTAGVYRGDLGWVRTLCEEHYAETLKEYE